jgi:hypothetical protein
VAILAGAGVAGALADAPASVPSGGVQISSVVFEPDVAWSGWVGLPIDGVVGFRVENTTGRPIRDLTPRVVVDDDTHVVLPLDIAAGDSTVVTVPVRLGGMPGANHAIVVEAGAVTATVTQRSVPWALIVAAAAAANVALLHGRDRLRAAVTRRTVSAAGQPVPRSIG